MKKKSFGIRLYLYNLIIISLVVGGLFYGFLWYYIQNQNAKVDAQLEERMIQAEENVEDTILMLDTIALQLSTNPEINHIMSGISVNRHINYFERNPIAAEGAYELLWSYILNPDNVSKVSVYNQYGDYIFAGEVTDSQKEKYRDVEFITELEESFEQERVNSRFINDVNKSIGIERQGISVIREIKDSYLIDNTGLGYVEVELNLDKLEEKIMSGSSNQVVIIYDLLTDMILGTSIEGYVENTKWSHQQLVEQLDMTNHYSITGELEAYNLGFIVLQDKQEQNLFVTNTIILGIVLYLWLILSMAYIQKRVVRVLTEPLIQLCDTIEYAESKQSRLLAIEESNIYEIEILSTAFYDMINRLETSMQQEMDIRTSQIKTQLYALQTQMNPHFIHNTLAIIQSYAIEEDYDTIINTCGRLSDLIRYSAKLANRKVMVKDEIAHIQNYMVLLKLRYENNIRYGISVPSELKQREIPSFILQPLIENSLSHGLKNSPFPWEIMIFVYERDGKWIIEIRDNGCGMTADAKLKIAQYREEMLKRDKSHLLEMEDWEIGGLTMRNIMVRLFLEYGEDMVFEIDSREDEYTIIRIGGRI